MNVPSLPDLALTSTPPAKSKLQRPAFISIYVFITAMGGGLLWWGITRSATLLIESAVLGDEFGVAVERNMQSQTYLGVAGTFWIGCSPPSLAGW
jgi:hypothetical protein